MARRSGEGGRDSDVEVLGTDPSTLLEVREMAELSAKKREQLPAKEFGLPEKARTKDAKKESGNYPMPDKAHARNAKARAAQRESLPILVWLRRSYSGRWPSPAFR